MGGRLNNQVGRAGLAWIEGMAKSHAPGYLKYLDMMFKIKVALGCKRRSKDPTAGNTVHKAGRRVASQR